MSLFYDELYYLLSKNREIDIEFYKKWVRQSEGKRVLDLGGGYGRIANELIRSHSCDQVTIVDAQVWMVNKGNEIAKTNGYVDQIEVIKADITQPLDEHLPLSWFDCAICVHNMINELLSDDKLEELFSNISHHLESNSLCVLDTYVINSNYPSKVIEYLDALEMKNNDILEVTSMMQRDKLDPSRYILHFYYEVFSGIEKVSSQRWLRTLQRKDWSVEEIIEKAERHGLQFHTQVTEPFGINGTLALIFKKHS